MGKLANVRVSQAKVYALKRQEESHLIILAFLGSPRNGNTTAMVNALYTKIIKADCLVFGTPVYMGQMTGQMKNFLTGGTHS